MDRPTSDIRRWLALAIVTAAQFLAVMDAFIVNVAIPSIRSDLNASTAEIEAVVAVYQIAYAALVITGGRLGDISGRKRIFIAGVLGFTLASLCCALAASAPLLIIARAAQGAAAALMVPQVLASIHTLFPDAARARAFAVLGIAIGLGAATGFILGGWLVALGIGGLGWRAIFDVNVPVGTAIAVAASWLVPPMARNEGGHLDLPGAAVLFAGLLGLLAPLMFGRDLAWPWWLWLMMAAGAFTLAGFLRLQRGVERRGGMPLIDLALLEDAQFLAGICATFSFFLGNLSFYFVLTLFLQNGLEFPPFDAALTVLPLAFAFVAGSRLAASRGERRGICALIDGCFIQAAGLACIALLVAAVERPTMAMLMLPLVAFGFGQGIVLTPLFSAVLSLVRHAHAGAGSGMLTTTQQVANGAGVVVIGAVYFAARSTHGDRWAMLAAVAALACTIVSTVVCLLRLRPGAVTAPSPVRRPSRP